MQYQQKQWLYVERPSHRVGGEHYRLVDTVIDADLAKNEVLIEAQYISVDPYMRIQQSASPTWDEPHPLNAVQGAMVVSRVKESSHAEFSVGDWVSAYTGWQKYALVHGSELEKLDPHSVDVTNALGVLGMPGRTAWFGLMEAGAPQAGDVVVVSGAAGAVGSLVTQFAVKCGCKVIALAGSDAKCQWLSSLGAHASLNYHDFPDASSLRDKLLALGGVDVYFDNVGGVISDAVVYSLNLRARIVVCGQISQYSGHLDNPELGPRFLHQLLYKRARIQGILARDYAHRMDEMVARVRPWIQSGEIQFETTIFEGFEKLPETLAGLFEGKNTGKAIVKV